MSPGRCHPALFTGANILESQVLIETSLLTRRYGSFTALDECSLEVSRGEVFGLLGPNGAGKTTLLRLLMGFLRPSSGWAKIDGLDCYTDSVKVHRGVGYLPGDARLFPGMRGRDVLKFFAGVRPGGDYQKSLQLAERLDLDLNRRVGMMSTGMRQKAALAAILAFDTQLLILDEPTANLDPTVRSEVAKMVKEARTDGRTVVFSSHVLSEVEEVCDRVVILRGGKLVHSQTMSDLRRRHRIRARSAGGQPLEAILPPGGPADITVQTTGSEVMIETPGELAPLLGWLATLQLEEVRIEPVGLRSIYDEHHPPK